MGVLLSDEPKEKHTIRVSPTTWETGKLCAKFLGISMCEFIEMGLKQNFRIVIHDVLKGNRGKLNG